MSFIYSKEVLEKLAQIAGTSPAEIEAKEFVSESNKINLAMRLISGITDELEAPITPVQTKYEDKTADSLTAVNLEDLKALVRYVASNLISINNKVIAASDILTPSKTQSGTISMLSQADKDQLKESFKGDRTLLINPQNLREYIVFLQKDAYNKNNKIFILMIGKIVEEFNETYPALKIGEKEGVEEVKAKEDISKKPTEADLSEADLSSIIIDSFNKEIVPNVFPAGLGNEIKVTLKDLSDPRSFYNFYTSKGITYPLDYGGSVGVKQTPISKENMCGFLNYVYTRALDAVKNINYNPMALENPKYKKALALYPNYVLKLFSEYSCPLPSGATAPTAAAAAISTKEDEASKASKIEAAKEAEYLSLTFPLRKQSGDAIINMNDVSDYIDKSLNTEIIKSNPTLGGYLRRTKSNADTVKSLFPVPQFSFPASTDYPNTAIKLSRLFVEENKTGGVQAFVRSLQQLQSMLDNFSDYFKDLLRNKNFQSPRYKEAIQNQVSIADEFRKTLEDVLANQSAYIMSFPKTI